MPDQWAIDLGTTNSVVASAEGGSVRTLHLPGLGRALPTDQSPLIPSAVHISEEMERFLYFFHRRRHHVYVGQQALSRNFDGRSPSFAQSFKRLLAREPHRAVVRCGSTQWSARDVAQLFLKELLAAAGRQSHQKIVDLTIPAPVGYYEHYRSELRSMASHLGIKRFRSLDEPVAAALGHGVNVARDETLLVVDFGGGTLNLAVAQLGPHTSDTGIAPVLAKHMVNVGGDDVDRWLMEYFVPSALLDMPEWQRDLKWEAMLVKEQVSRGGRGEFRWGGLKREFTREDLVGVMRDRGLYEQLRIALSDIRRQLTETPGLEGRGVDEVLLVGGSTLLPEVAAVVDDAFPEAVVRHDPEYVFTAVALGAARYAGGVAVDDFVYHDYAVQVQNEKTHSVEYELLIPRRTRYPTAKNFAVRYYADFPGMAEMRFSICEVGRLGQAPVAWAMRPNGSGYWAPQGDEQRGLIQELNPADAPLPLRPAGQGTSPRLRVTYSINADRWLCITVEDLIRKQPIREDEPVVRLR
ncbi:MAG: Molecular chaperone DnaK [Armatimonadetes bacterium]|jgi:molecular chaperone DnaK (HSP70)|nr:Molecular chaperone DnaK [Armatimonadota bacterium]